MILNIIGLMDRTLAYMFRKFDWLGRIKTFLIAGTNSLYSNYQAIVVI